MRIESHLWVSVCRKRLGQLAQIDAGGQTVAEFAHEWWRVHAEPNLTPRTRETYAIVFDKHILPRVGGLALRDVTPAVVAGLSADLQRGGVGPAATRKALTVLQGIFSCAVTWGHVQSNPVVGVRKPSAKRQRAVVPPSLAVVERMRALLLAERRYATRRCSRSSPTPVCALKRRLPCRGRTSATERS